MSKRGNGWDFRCFGVELMGKKILVSLADEETKTLEMTDEENKEADDFLKQWNDAAPERAMAALRQERNAKLAETDWWAFPDSPEMPDSQTKYRQDLRDITKQDDLNNITWPTKPS